MNETYVECMVARKKSPLAPVLKVVVWAIVVLLFLIGMAKFIFFILAIAAGIVAYLFLPQLDIEYEYLYLDREITIDKVIAKQKRKRVRTIELNKMEIFAPYSSHELDSYKSRNVKTADYSSNFPDAKPYAIVYHDQNSEEMILLEPNQEMIKAVKMVYPRKVVEY